jgi:hypothetical protein
MLKEEFIILMEPLTKPKLPYSWINKIQQVNIGLVFYSKLIIGL